MNEDELRTQLWSEIRAKQALVEQLNLEIEQLKSDVNELKIGIHKLPREIMLMIFRRFLNFSDLVRCMHVCKKWRKILTCLNISSIVFTGSSIVFNGSYKDFFHTQIGWFFKTKKYNRNLYCDLMKFTAPESEPMGSVLFTDTLKRLKFEKIEDHTYIMVFVFKLINKMISLESVELSVVIQTPDNRINDELKRIVDINLPNLKSLDIDNLTLELITLNTPNLISFKARHINKGLLFTYPDSLRHLFVLSFDQKSIEIFKNLETIYIEKINFQSFDMPLDKFPNLKELALWIYPRSYSVDLSPFGLDIPKFTYITKLKKILQKERDLKFTYFGMEITKHLLNCFDFRTPFEQPKRDLAELLIRHQDYFSSLSSDLSWIKQIIYPLSNVDAELPVLHDKFNGIQCINVEKRVENQTHFLNFLKGFKNLKSLNICYSSLNDSFYEKIHHLLTNSTQFPHIQHLSIYERSAVISKFDFLLEFVNLHSFRTNKQVPVDLIIKIIKKAEDHNFTFWCECKGVEIKIDKIDFPYELRYKRSTNLYKFYDLKSLENCLK